MAPFVVEPVELDVPVITITSEGDTRLFRAHPADFMYGDSPMRRHWQVSGAPHSDPRSAVIPDNAEVTKACRLPRQMDQAYVEALSAFPIEPIITGAMVAMQR